MDTYISMYRDKLKSADEAVLAVRDGDWVDYGQTCSFPAALDRALAHRCGQLRDVKVRSAISMLPVQVVEKDPEQESFTFHVWHCSSLDRQYIDSGRAYFSPMLFRDCGSYYTRGYARVDVAMLTVSPMDANGDFGFGLTNCCTQELLDSARHIILEVNPNMPRVSGIRGDRINISRVDCVVENDSPPPSPASAGISPVDEQIASVIFPYLEDGVTLQLGIGSLPNALGRLIAGSELSDLGMHTELMSDGYLELYKAGKITNRRKALDRGKGVFSICFGSRELYDYLDGNTELLSAPISYVNDPDVIRGFDGFVSINGCIACDLYGQVSSESVGMRQISGTGGQLDFVTGAYMSPHGKAFLAMSSTFTDRQGQVHSRIRPRFTDGDIITVPRTQTPYIATEYGAVNLAGLTTWERAEKLVSVAHPDFRDELINAAEKQHIWRRSNKR